MMTLISLAIIVAFGTSLAATFGLFEIEVWWELASLITIMVLGHWLEMRAISQARGALNALAALLPDTAERVSGTETHTVPISDFFAGLEAAAFASGCSASLRSLWSDAVSCSCNSSERVGGKIDAGNILNEDPPIQSFASHARASSRVRKLGNSRRENLLKFSENP